MSQGEKIPVQIQLLLASPDCIRHTYNAAFEWKLFKQYNVQDVVTEQEIECRLSPFPVPEKVQKQWEAALRMNARGVAIDMDLVAGVLDCSERITTDRNPINFSNFAKKFIPFITMLGNT